MKLSTEQLKELRALCNDSTVWASVLDELIAIRELKGDQVPVEYQIYYHNHGTGGGEWCRVSTKARYEELQREHAGDNDFSFRTLFTAPQKPVVLPQRYTSASLAGQGITVKDTGGDLLDRLQVIAAIEAAGGIVKDGE